jgi:NAD(P)H-hydrate epimerase
MRVLSAEAMREVDRRAIEEIGIPSLVLMENAAVGVAEVIGEMGEEVDSVAIFCGPGNNGGDGLALARHLDARGYALEVFLATAGKPLRGDAAVQQGICEKQGIELQEIGSDDDLDFAAAVARECDLVVDALFGTGLTRPLEGFFAELVAALNELPVPRLAVDLPSGLSGSRPDVFGPTFRADRTVTFAAPKRPMVLLPAAEWVGEVVVTDLGIPAWLLDEVEEEGGRLLLMEPGELAPGLPPREPEGHKGTYGHGLLVAGGPGKTGAAVLAARAAVRGAAGLVTAAVPEPLRDIVDLGSLESMTLGLPATADGVLAAPAAAAVAAALDGKTALALGPGLGQVPETAGAIRQIVLAAPVPLVLDADGLNAFAGRAGELAGRSAATVLTPHPGELGRLLGLESSEIQKDRLAAVRRAARETGSVVVLKGHRTLVAEPEGDVHVCLAGNPGMATGGTGDVLTGLLLGLLCRLGKALPAAVQGVWLHATAGDLALEKAGPESLAAGDLVEALPEAFRRLAEGG